MHKAARAEARMVNMRAFLGGQAALEHDNRFIPQVHTLPGGGRRFIVEHLDDMEPIEHEYGVGHGGLNGRVDLERRCGQGNFWGKGIGDGLGVCNQRSNRLESQDFLNAFGGCGWMDVGRWAGV